MILKLTDHEAVIKTPGIVSRQIFPANEDRPQTIVTASFLIVTLLALLSCSRSMSPAKKTDRSPDIRKAAGRLL